MTLEVAGVTEAEEAVYRVLVTTNQASLQEVANRVGLCPAETRRVLDALTGKSMVSQSEGSPRHYRATPPDVALLPRLNNHADAVDRARAESVGLLETYRATMRRQDTGRLIEIITGAGALRQHLRQIQEEARDELLWFCKARYVAMPSGSNAAEYEALARGVRYRVLYERAFFDDEGAVNNVVEGVRAGETARAVPHVPLRMVVADRTLAICPLAGGPEEPTAALVRDSNLVAALIALFERYWQDAVPLVVDDSGTVTGTDAAGLPDHVSATDRRLLALLVAGVADKAVASQLGLSRRTVQRHIHRMMKQAGAATRMQLAWQAARRGWL